MAFADHDIFAEPASPEIRDMEHFLRHSRPLPIEEDGLLSEPVYWSMMAAIILIAAVVIAFVLFGPTPGMGEAL